MLIKRTSETGSTDVPEIIAVGDVVQVKVLEVDIPRKRISLTRKF